MATLDSFYMIAYLCSGVACMLMLMKTIQLSYKLRKVTRELEECREDLSMEEQISDDLSTAYSAKCAHKDKVDERLRLSRQKIRKLRSVVDKIHCELADNDEQLGAAYNQLDEMKLRTCPPDCKWKAHRGAGIFPCPSCRIVRSNYIPTKNSAK